MAERSLRDGQLVAPYDLVIAQPARYPLVCPLGCEICPQVAAFEELIVSEANKMTCFAKGRRMIPLAEIIG